MSTAKKTTTDAPRAKRRPRASKRVVRTWAWIAGLISFFVPAATLAGNASAATPVLTTRGSQSVVIVRHLIRRVVIVDPSGPAVPTRSVTVGAAPVIPAPPVTTTQGS
jgi:hypothetical protein